MAITTMDGVIGALPGQVRPYVKSALGGTFVAGDGISLWTAAGNPSTGAAQGTINGAVPDNTVVGSVPFTNPGAGNTYIGRAYMASNISGTLVLYDRLWHDSAFTITSTSAQAITQPALTRPDANGNQTELFLEVYTATGAATPNATVSYTNSGGTASHSAVVALRSASPVGLALPFPLQAGDTGVKSVQSLTLSASAVSGNIGLTIARRICEFPISAANVGQLLDVFALGMPQIYNSACIWGVYFIGSGTAAPIVAGSMALIQG